MKKSRMFEGTSCQVIQAGRSIVAASRAFFISAESTARTAIFGAPVATARGTRPVIRLALAVALAPAKPALRTVAAFARRPIAAESAGLKAAPESARFAAAKALFESAAGFKPASARTKSAGLAVAIRPIPAAFSFGARAVVVVPGSIVIVARTVISFAVGPIFALTVRAIALILVAEGAISAFGTVAAIRSITPGSTRTIIAATTVGTTGPIIASAVGARRAIAKVLFKAAAVSASAAFVAASTATVATLVESARSTIAVTTAVSAAITSVSFRSILAVGTVVTFHHAAFLNRLLKRIGAQLDRTGDKSVFQLNHKLNHVVATLAKMVN
jgi:hypothetical protein